MADDIASFINARLDEDQRVALEALEAIETIAWEPGYKPDPAEIGSMWCDPDGPGVHVAARPARVLVQVAAMRAIVGIHEPYDHESYGPCCEACAGGQGEGLPWPCPTLVHLASIWRDHPDYRQEWDA